jgi:hypothetical protein
MYPRAMKSGLVVTSIFLLLNRASFGPVVKSVGLSRPPTRDA